MLGPWTKKRETGRLRDLSVSVYYLDIYLRTIQLRKIELELER
jgi:hypothetical protein